MLAEFAAVPFVAGRLLDETVPGSALVAWVPLTVPPAVLIKMRSSVSGFCQNSGATSMTTWYWLRGA